MLTFHRNYFIATLLLLLIEILIALFIHDEIIRPYIGDFLVVILIYCFIKSFTDISVLPSAIITLLFSYLVETLQYFKIVEMLGLQHYKLAKVIIGTSFAWTDILCYSLGILAVLIVEKLVWGKALLRTL
ncbi:MAG: DUF2809 domain-containing protein [Ferruginibacter sp.]